MARARRARGAAPSPSRAAGTEHEHGLQLTSPHEHEAQDARDASDSLARETGAARAAAELARERAADRLVQLAGEQARAGLDPLDPAHASYFAWLAADRRAALSRDERRALADDARAFAAALLRGDGARPTLPGLVRGAPVEREATRARGADAVRAAAAAGCAPRFALAVAAGAGRELWDEPAASWVALPAHVPAGQHVALTVSGDSMEPMLHAGDTILVRLGHGALVGDVVVARLPEDGYVVKRVHAVSEDALVLASLNAAYADVRVRPEPGTVVGTVVMRWCGH